jgi:hypothetical protein
VVIARQRPVRDHRGRDIDRHLRQYTSPKSVVRGSTLVVRRSGSSFVFVVGFRRTSNVERRT